VISLVDASAMVDLLVRSNAGERVRRRLRADADAMLVTVAHLDAEVLSALARLHRAGELTAVEVEELLRRISTMDLRRLPISAPLQHAAWQLRANIAARDALYVAAAQGLRCSLLTTDERLTRAVPELAVDLGDEGPLDG
jgi:predicted nucleic acid-binding protein